MDGSDRDRDERVGQPSTPWLVQPDAAARTDQTGTATRIALRPHDPGTGEEIEKSQVVKGYECDRGQFVTFSAEELRALDVESSKVIDLERFVPRGEIDPVYVDTPYYLYPDGPIAVEALRVIGVAMAEAGDPARCLCSVVVGHRRLCRGVPVGPDLALAAQDHEIVGIGHDPTAKALPQSELLHPSTNRRM